MKENKFIPLRKNIVKSMNWWKNQSLPGVYKDKGGSFNLELYMKYLNVVNESDERQLRK
jgi:hypothetical protein